MKLPLRSLPVVLLCLLSLFSSRVARADLLPLQDPSFTGTIIEEPSASAQPYVKTPITKKTLLGIVGHPEVSPNSTAFFWDQNTSNFVLASKDKTTTYCALTGFSSGLLNLYAKGNRLTNSIYNCKALDSRFTGSLVYTGDVHDGFAKIVFNVVPRGPSVAPPSPTPSCAPRSLPASASSISLGLTCWR